MKNATKFWNKDRSRKVVLFFRDNSDITSLKLIVVESVSYTLVLPLLLNAKKVTNFLD